MCQSEIVDSPVELTVKQQNNNVKIKRNGNCKGQGRRSA